MIVRSATDGQMNELMYGINTFWIASAILCTMLLAIEAGYRLGLQRHAHESDSSRAHLNSILAANLGVLALLLGFTFSLSMQRFESRSKAVVDEANAIGTTVLRAQLLPDGIRDDVQHLLRRYVEVRAEAAATRLDNAYEREAQLVEARRLQDALWSAARRTGEADARVIPSGLFIQAVNELIDSFGRRTAELDRHVPEIVMILLYGTLLMTGLIIGYTAGTTGRRASFGSYILTGLIVLLVFVIVDLDRPRRGLITVDHTPLTNLQNAIGPDVAFSAAGGVGGGAAEVSHPAARAAR